MKLKALIIDDEFNARENLKLLIHDHCPELDIIGFAESAESAESIEKSILDKLGKNDIKWEKDGFISKSKLWLTYEEIIDANASKRPLQNEEGSRDRVGGATA